MNKGIEALKTQLETLTLVGSLSTKAIGKEITEISKEVIMSISLTDPSEFDYNLILQNDDNLDWTTICFPISNDCHFKLLTHNNIRCILWERNKCFYLFKILLDTTNDSNYKSFITILKEMVLSVEFQIPIEQAAKESSINDYITQYQTIENVDRFIEDNYKHYSVPKENLDDLTKMMGESSLTKTLKGSFLVRYPQAKNCFTSTEGMFFKYDRTTDQFNQIGDKCVFSIYAIKDYDYVIIVEEVLEQNKQLESVSEPTLITASASITIDSNDNMIKWLGGSSQSFLAYGFLFNNPKDLELMMVVLSKCKYESSAQSNFDKLEEDERNWIMKENKCDPEENWEIADDIDLDFDNDNNNQLESDKNLQKENKFTEQAYLFDRTFVFKKDNTIEVYKSDEDNISQLMNLPAVQTFNDKHINLMNAQMYKGDTNMILLDQNNPNSLFQYDIPKGQIVEEWKAGDMTNILSICPEKKLGQMTDNQTLFGINGNNLFTLDGRLNKQNKLVDSKAYKTNVNMNCISTTEFGGIVTGSLKGEIRLYNEMGKNAKTLLQCYSDPIRSIDVTKDGKFIVATCDYYLLIFNTAMQNTNGFLTRLGKNKPSPRTLQLNPIDKCKYGLEKAKYTAARFNIGKDRETNIITSLGEFIIVWNMDKIKKGILNDYKIKRVNQVVIDNQYKFDKNQVVVTMPNILRIQNQKKLE